ncbi:MAG: bifunctional demethylmenaquinone methyltransferase/2-methoxy-6-polyprenyl-1,4-benzoquinol methylase UbiE [Myxococcales bacterium]|nr:bifunctional demethylmenaquinone methyltransferase/2-methoxy-6-polyprenyl-1,4-benzoquinol methylase UbiE [Myxococcales bacterium]
MNSLRDDSKKTSFEIFDRIAKSYDLANRVLSFGLDAGWRKKVGTFLPHRTRLKLLDLATGTGDQIIMLCDSSHDIESAVGMDLSEEMLALGRKKTSRFNGKVKMKTGDAVQLPIKDAQYDVITISFGIRNVSDVPASMKEMYRVLNKEGKALILEFSMPENSIFRLGHVFYLRWVVPVIGGLLSGDYAAYKYLNTSIEAFPHGDAFCKLLKEAGFEKVQAHPVTFGIATIYEAYKKQTEELSS